jgi:formate hydrogenlyase subunit 4
VADAALLIGGSLALSAFGIAAGLLFSGIDRILAARMQARVGPPLRQPFLDVLKLMTKENIVPEHAVDGLFNAAPVLALASSLVLLFYLPLGSLPPLLGEYGDLILILYLLIVPALAMVAGGFASSSPYATIGAQREMVTMISYELPLVVIVIAFAWRLNVEGLADPFSLGAIAAHPMWSLVGPVGFAGCLLLLLALLIVTPGELSRIPFDTPEAETELAGGLLVEYSGRNLALFYVAQGVRTVAMASLAVALFFPHSLSACLSLGGPAGAAADIAFYLVKMVVVILLAVTLLRVAMARLRITHVVALYWKYVGAMSLLGLILIMADAAIRR